MLGLLNSPFSGILGKPPGYLPPDSLSVTADILEKFPGVARMATRLDSSSFLDSRSSSPEDSETSGFSSGSDHLCDMLVRCMTFILQLVVACWVANAYMPIVSITVASIYTGCAMNDEMGLYCKLSLTSILNVCTNFMFISWLGAISLKGPVPFFFL